MKTVIIADDDFSICKVLRHALTHEGYEVITMHNGDDLLNAVNDGLGDIVITDVLMPGESGLDILPRIKAQRPDLPVIVISAQNTLFTAVKAAEAGAYDYLPKPFELESLIATVAKSVGGQQDITTLPVSPSFEQGAVPIIGHSHAMQDVYKTLARVISVDLSILITGESGTGKELVARALHALSNRKHRPFIARNVAAIPKDLVESELFGHEKGAFTGAVNRKQGAFELAGDGVLFLDEIGDMPPEAQTRLLRVLQQGEFSPVGSTHTLHSRARIISATHADLSKLVASGAFRKDLFYRLNVVQVRMPPLRERKEDIPALVSHFLQKAMHKGLPQKYVAEQAMPLLLEHHWPGNVRELENLVYRLSTLYPEPVISSEAVRLEIGHGTFIPVASSESPIFSESIRQHVSTYFRSHGESLPPAGVYDRLLPLFEKPLLEITLEATGGNQFKAANLLGINRNTLRKKIRELGINIHSN